MKLSYASEGAYAEPRVTACHIHGRDHGHYDRVSIFPSGHYRGTAWNRSVNKAANIVEGNYVHNRF